MAADRPPVIAEQPAAPPSSDTPATPAAPPQGLWPKIKATAKQAVPEKVVKLIEIWGLPILVGVAVGIVPGATGVVAICRYEVMPAKILVCSGEKPPGPPAAPEDPVQDNPRVTYKEIDAPPAPVDLAEKYLQRVAVENAENELHKEPLVGTVMSDPLPRTGEFSWVIRTTSSNFRITGEAFRRTTKDGRVVFEPLEASQDSSQASITFRVHPCQKGDVLFAALAITSHLDINIDFSGTFK